MPNSSTTRVALIQMSCAPSTAQNLDHAADLVREAARAGAQLICLPELFRAQYFCQREDHALFALAEPIPGPSTARLAAIVREEKITLITSLFERRAPGLYHNTAAILDHESNRDCVIDNIDRDDLVWQTTPETGTYQVWVDLFRACGQPAATFTVSLWLAETQPDGTQRLIEQTPPLVNGELTAIQANGGTTAGLFVGSFVLK